MVITQAAAYTRERVPDVATLRTDLETTRSAYHQLLSSITDDDLQRPCAISKWTVKEVLCHLVLQVEQAVPMMVKHARKRRPMPAILNSRFGHWLNYTMAVRAARKATREELAERYDAALDALLHLLGGVAADEWALPTAYPDGTPLTMETVFRVPADHFALHAAWIRRTLQPPR